jgi:hypothetical protein
VESNGSADPDGGGAPEPGFALATAGFFTSKMVWHFAQRIFFDGLPSKRSSPYWYLAWH